MGVLYTTATLSRGWVGDVSAEAQFLVGLVEAVNVWKRARARPSLRTGRTRADRAAPWAWSSARTCVVSNKCQQDPLVR